MKATSSALISSPGQSPEHTGAACPCHGLSPGAKARLPCHSQSSSVAARPAGLRTTSGLSDFKIPKRRVPRTSVRPQGALGRAVWTEAAMTCQAACTTVSLVLGGRGDPSLVGRPAPVRWPRRGRFPASQALGDRPSGPPSPPSPRPAWESLRGPSSSRARLHDAGLRLTSVPATATAWQQRATRLGRNK